MRRAERIRTIDVMDVQTTVAVASFIVATLGGLSGLRAQARPKLRIRPGHCRRVTLAPGEEATITFHIESIRRWHLRRVAATRMSLYVNVPGPVLLRELRYGAGLQRVTDEIRRGRGTTRYLAARESITATPYEYPERIAVALTAPHHPGRYRCWIAAVAAEGDCGRHAFTIRVRAA